MYRLINFNNEEKMALSYHKVSYYIRDTTVKTVALVQNQADIKWIRIQHTETKYVYLIYNKNQWEKDTLFSR